MAIRRILTYPDPLLHRISEPVTKFDLELSNLVNDMVETMRHAPGIGLAAPQVGELLRVIVVEIPPDREEEGKVSQLYAVCNPVISKRAGNAKIEEGCLSVPGFYVEVDRAAEVTIEGQNPDGTPFRYDSDGLTAICFQHEIDHLDGKLLINYVSSTKRALYRDELKRRQKTDGTVEDRRPAL
ncbi:MAG TPA: peptide deformylase [Bdellovibrionota bacterium]|nr:peptide deformylase [Bdellovibrionota bacterium]